LVVWRDRQLASGPVTQLFLLFLLPRTLCLQLIFPLRYLFAPLWIGGVLWERNLIGCRFLPPLRFRIWYSSKTGLMVRLFRFVIYLIIQFIIGGLGQVIPPARGIGLPFGGLRLSGHLCPFRRRPYRFSRLIPP